MRRLIRASAAVLLTASILIPTTARGAADSAPSRAKIEAVQNQVETRQGAGGAWSPSAVGQSLFDRDRVRTGAASRAAILYSDQTLHRIGEKSEVEIVPADAGKPSLLQILSGKHYFSSRTPKDYGRIETPTVTAAIRGTEFAIEVAEDSTTTITMVEGVVLASNEAGSLEVRKGEQAYVERGKAPVKRILVKPRDAVAWALYYPPVLGGSDADAGKPLAKAAHMLSEGQVEEARAAVGKARKEHPSDPVALALASVVELSMDHKEEAARLADEAMKADPKSPAAALAGSYAAQASFRIERARELAEKAAQLDPKSSVALARAAELRMAEGDIQGAKKAAEEAVRRTPGDARALTVLGFVELADFHTDEAEKSFDKAVAADGNFSLAHLGRGITRIRRGHVQAGREELQTAALLDPADSLLRSYLGKAYYEERRTTEAGKELAAAKDLDPSDPTPYLYDAIRKQNDNRPVEALGDLQESIDRNDRRGVYRSRLLLDEDRAVRGTDLARIYNDLGFEQLGLVTARRSADQDQANFSSHYFLSGNYRNVPFFAPAFLSEVLQARIYQPVSANAARPDAINESVSFNEYTALFDRPRPRAFAGVEARRTDTDLSELSPSDPSFIDPITLDESGSFSGDATGTLNGDRYAAALSYRKDRDEGFRVNSDAKNAVYRGFFEYSPGYRDSFQVNLLRGRRESGDLPLRQIPALEFPERFETEESNIGLGWHHLLTPANDLAVSAIYNKTEQSGGFIGSGITNTGTLKGPQLEVQDVWRTSRIAWIFGAGGFDGDVELSSPFGSDSGDDKFWNGYAYAKLRGMGPFEVTAGASVERVESPAGLIPPRDSNILPADVPFTETRVSPKLGVSWYARSKTTLRAAGFYRLSPNLGRLQTLEPTQVAGFNQFFEEPGGTRSRSWGAGVDQEFAKWLFGGASLLFRRLDIPEAYCTTEDPFSGCAFQLPTVIVHRDSRETLSSAYLNATLGKRFAAGVDYALRTEDFDSTRISPVGLFQDYIRTSKLRPQARFFLPNGFFAGGDATLYRQQVDQFDDLTSDSRNSVNARFWIGNVHVGYRFPRRFGSAILEAQNVSDREFDFYDRAIQDTVIPARTVSLRVNFTY